MRVLLRPFCIPRTWIYIPECPIAWVTTHSRSFPRHGHSTLLGVDSPLHIAASGPSPHLTRVPAAPSELVITPSLCRPCPHFLGPCLVFDSYRTIFVFLRRLYRLPHSVLFVLICLRRCKMNTYITLHYLTLSHIVMRLD